MVKRIGIIAMVMTVFGALVVGSFVRARGRSDALIERISEQWERTDTRLTVIRSITGRAGPSWDFSYEPVDSFVTGPLTVQMSLFGQPIATNPRNALAELQKLP